MKVNLTWFDRIMSAVTFAEANEHDIGREFLVAENRSEKERKCKACDAILMTDMHGTEVHS